MSEALACCPFFPSASGSRFWPRSWRRKPSCFAGSADRRNGYSRNCVGVGLTVFLMTACIASVSAVWRD